MVQVVRRMKLKDVNQITETYRALRCTGYTQPKAMERIIQFAKESPKVREKVLRDMLRAEKSLGKCRIN